jgi:ribonuclease P protein component
MYTFTKEERLCNKRLIDSLFHSGSSFLCYPFKVSWAVNDEPPMPAQVLFAVPKKRFKHATDRNTIKRRMREAYRLNKQEQLYNILGDKKLILALTYVGKEIESSELIHKRMIKTLTQLSAELSK